MARPPQRSGCPGLIIAVLLVILVVASIPLLTHTAEKLSRMYGPEKIEQRR